MPNYDALSGSFSSMLPRLDQLDLVSDGGTKPQPPATNDIADPACVSCAQASPSELVDTVISANKHSKRAAYKAQKRTYRSQKKEAAKELLSNITNPAVILLGDWLKVRGTLKTWSKLWCVLKPGVLILYKSEKRKGSQWAGTILLNTCQLLERPSKKDGFCYKLFHPLDQSIWAAKGPKGETIGSFVQPLPYSYCIFRAPSESAGKCWMDALDLAMRCSGLLNRSMSRLESLSSEVTVELKAEHHDRQPAAQHRSLLGEGEFSDKRSRNDSFHETDSKVFADGFQSMDCDQRNMNDSDLEKHFANQGLGDDKSEREETDSSQSESEHGNYVDRADIGPPVETSYVSCVGEELGQNACDGQTEEVSDVNRSLIWTLAKQVRPGMDLSKVVLPTFILEPRSFLDKLSDYYYHCDILSMAVLEESPYDRMKSVVKWYLSGFYKKPKGLKKPYNPVIGECFRCCWHHQSTDSRTFYIAEQVSHHPPVSAFHVTNRKDGFNISGSILARSKFYGNSLSAIFLGVARLSFLDRGEEYYITMPYAHCKGILIGTLTMELGGHVTINCMKTGYKCELEFKLKPFFGIGQATNRLHGKILMASDVMASIDGHWDQQIFIKDRASGNGKEVFWSASAEVIAGRLERCTVPVEGQQEFESERLWGAVSRAVSACDMQTATDEKYVIEERQRCGFKERKLTNTEWATRFFEKDVTGGGWIYKHSDDRPWDPVTDVYQYEHEFVVQTQTRHRTPHIRVNGVKGLGGKRSDKNNFRVHSTIDESDSSCRCAPPDSDSSDFAARHSPRPGRPNGAASGDKVLRVNQEGMAMLLEPLANFQDETKSALQRLQLQMARLEMQQSSSHTILSRDWFTFALIFVFQFIIQWLFR